MFRRPFWRTTRTVVQRPVRGWRERSGRLRSMLSKMACRKRSDRDLSLPGLCLFGELFITAIILYPGCVSLRAFLLSRMTLLKILRGVTNIIVLITCTRNAVEHKSAWSLVLDKGAFGLQNFASFSTSQPGRGFCFFWDNLCVFSSHVFTGDRHSLLEV